MIKQGDSFLTTQDINLEEFGREGSVPIGTSMLVVGIDQDEMPEGYKVYFEGFGHPKTDWSYLSEKEIIRYGQSIPGYFQIVFLTTMKQKASKKESSGRAIIAQDEDRWIAGWSTENTRIPYSLDETWYNGVSWEDLLNAFREEVAAKIKLGYVPELDSPTITHNPYC